LLGQAFMKITWIDEAVHTFRQAIDTYKVTNDDTGLALRYGLLSALQAKAEGDRDLAIAEEADKLASAIAVQQFTYRDIRARRAPPKTPAGAHARGAPAGGASPAVILIPARMASPRSPGKVLADKPGHPLIQPVYESARRARVASRVVI